MVFNGFCGVYRVLQGFIVFIPGSGKKPGLIALTIALHGKRGPASVGGRTEEALNSFF